MTDEGLKVLFAEEFFLFNSALENKMLVWGCDKNLDIFSFGSCFSIINEPLLKVITEFGKLLFTEV